MEVSYFLPIQLWNSVSWMFSPFESEIQKVHVINTAKAQYFPFIRLSSRYIEFECMPYQPRDRIPSFMDVANLPKGNGGVQRFLFRNT